MNKCSGHRQTVPCFSVQQAVDKGFCFFFSLTGGHRKSLRKTIGSTDTRAEPDISYRPTENPTPIVIKFF